ncbi:NERD domain-containing protein [Comamonadaceae bacterium OH2545_COT-014]|nr:NERD domain-containing protein [Comamonadaceae bacterium OH2545_COT-014]
MLIKEADDKSRRLKLLEDLQQSPWLDARQKDWLHDELWRLRTGIQGEKDAAYYINADYGHSPHWAVLHDLRIEVDGEVAQIDHLLLSRTLIFLLETKSFNGNLSINAHGEFTVTYPASRKSLGIASPLEQSRRHEKVLRKLLDRLDIRSRTGSPMEMHHVVLLHPRVIIQRPSSKAFDTRNIIKADNLRAWYDQFVEQEIGFIKTFTTLANIRSQDTVRAWAEKLKRQHRPADPLSLPDFMQPSAPSEAAPAPAPRRASPARAAAPLPPSAAGPDLCATCGTALPPRVADYCRSHAEQFGGQLYCRLHQNPACAPSARPVAHAPRTSSAAATAAPPVCATCGATLSPRVADFCRKRPDRFGGQLYCMAHQATAG